MKVALHAGEVSLHASLSRGGASLDGTRFQATLLQMEAELGAALQMAAVRLAGAQPDAKAAETAGGVTGNRSTDESAGRNLAPRAASLQRSASRAAYSDAAPSAGPSDAVALGQINTAPTATVHLDGSDAMSAEAAAHTDASERIGGSRPAGVESTRAVDLAQVAGVDRSVRSGGSAIPSAASERTVVHGADAPEHAAPSAPPPTSGSRRPRPADPRVTVHLAGQSASIAVRIALTQGAQQELTDRLRAELAVHGLAGYSLQLNGSVVLDVNCSNESLPIGATSWR